MNIKTKMMHPHTHTNLPAHGLPKTGEKASAVLGRITAILLLSLSAGLTSCSPSEKTVSMPAALSATALSYKISQNADKDNIVYLESETAAAIPFWDYGSGTSTHKLDTVIFPFSGDYTIHYGVSSAGGYVAGDSTTGNW